MKVNFLQLLQESHEIDEYIEKEVNELTPEELCLKVNPKKWSAIEIIDHLNLTYDLYVPRLDKCFEDAAERKDVTEGASIRASRGLMIKSVAPKGSKRPFKMRTFPFFEPETASVETGPVLSRYLKYRKRFNSYLKDARHKDIDHSVVQSALKQVSFRAPEALKFLLSHEQRHIVQLQEALEVIPLRL